MLKPYYQDEWATIYHGDCRDILPQLEPVDLVLTDPPYPNGEGHFQESIEIARTVLPTLTAPAILSFWSELERPHCALPLVAVHIWHRTNVNGKIYEPIYHFASDGRKRRSLIKAHAAVFNGVGPGCNEYLGHPTQKPVELCQWLIKRHVEPVTVLDPFMGSGTTLRAAKDLGLKSIGIEIEEKYCEIAVNRLRQESLLGIAEAKPQARQAALHM